MIRIYLLSYSFGLTFLSHAEETLLNFTCILYSVLKKNKNTQNNLFPFVSFLIFPSYIEEMSLIHKVFVDRVCIKRQE